MRTVDSALRSIILATGVLGSLLATAQEAIFPELFQQFPQLQQQIITAATDVDFNRRFQTDPEFQRAFTASTEKIAPQVKQQLNHVNQLAHQLGVDFSPQLVFSPSPKAGGTHFGLDLNRDGFLDWADLDLLRQLQALQALHLGLLTYCQKTPVAAVDFQKEVVPCLKNVATRRDQLLKNPQQLSQVQALDNFLFQAQAYVLYDFTHAAVTEAADVLRYLRLSGIREVEKVAGWENQAWWRPDLQIEALLEVFSVKAANGVPAWLKPAVNQQALQQVGLQMQHWQFLYEETESLERLETAQVIWNEMLGSGPHVQVAPSLQKINVVIPAAPAADLPLAGELPKLVARRWFFVRPENVTLVEPAGADWPNRNVKKANQTLNLKQALAQGQLEGGLVGDQTTQEWLKQFTKDEHVGEWLFAFEHRLYDASEMLLKQHFNDTAFLAKVAGAASESSLATEPAVLALTANPNWVNFQNLRLYLQTLEAQLTAAQKELDEAVKGKVADAARDLYEASRDKARRQKNAAAKLITVIEAIEEEKDTAAIQSAADYCKNLSQVRRGVEEKVRSIWMNAAAQSIAGSPILPAAFDLEVFLRRLASDAETRKQWQRLQQNADVNFVGGLEVGDVELVTLFTPFLVAGR